jgi:hypothetical protein
MPKIIPALLAAATLFTFGLLALPSETRSAAPSAARFAAAGLVREAAIVCGGNGCNPVQTRAKQKRKFQTLGHG